MTRKKFIKILMSEGVSRNEAAACATWASAARRPYLLVSGDLLCFHRKHFKTPNLWWKAFRTIVQGHKLAIIVPAGGCPLGGGGQ